MKGQLLHKVFHTLTEAFQNCLRRFPSTVCFVLALTVYLVYLVATDMDDDRKLVMVLGYYFSIGTLLSLTLHLWSEEIKSKIKRIDRTYSNARIADCRCGVPLQPFTGTVAY